MYAIRSYYDLSNSSHLNNFDFQYKSDINTFFSSNKNDNSVQFVKKVLQNYHAHLSINGQFYDENFKNDTSFMQFLQVEDFGLPSTLTNKSIIIDSLNKAVESFAKISQFDKFIENHKGYYHQKIEEVSKEISSLDMINDFETFWGSKKENYTVITSYSIHYTKLYDHTINRCGSYDSFNQQNPKTM